MAFCSKCGAKLEEGARFCRNCGAPVVPIVQEDNKSQNWYHQSGDSSQKHDTTHAVKKKKKKAPIIIVAVVLAVVVIICALFFAGQGSSESYDGADTKSDTEIGIYHDTVYFREPQEVRLKVTTTTKKESEGDNYKMNCKVQIDHLDEPKIYDAGIKDVTLDDITNYELSGPCSLSAVFDSETGDCLECDNKYGVKYKEKGLGWKYTYFSSKSRAVLGKKVPLQLAKTETLEFTVTYPKSYKNLAIGAGFVNVTTKVDEADFDFWDGKKSYFDTVYYKQGENTVMYLGFDGSNPPSDDTDTSAESEISESSSNDSEKNDVESTSDASYEDIYNTYKKKIEKKTPQLVKEYKEKSAGYGTDINKCAELSTKLIEQLAAIETEGTEKMAELYTQIGGEYSDYQDWATELYNVYQDCSTEITNAYMNGTTQMFN